MQVSFTMEDLIDLLCLPCHLCYTHDFSLLHLLSLPMVYCACLESKGAKVPPHSKMPVLALQIPPINYVARSVLLLSQLGRINTHHL